MTRRAFTILLVLAVLVGGGVGGVIIFSTRSERQAMTERDQAQGELERLKEDTREIFERFRETVRESSQIIEVRYVPSPTARPTPGPVPSPGPVPTDPVPTAPPTPSPPQDFEDFACMMGVGELFGFDCGGP